MVVSLVDEVHEGEDRDPDHVYEVPVERGDVYDQCVLRLEAAFEVDGEEREQPEDAGGHVGAVEAGEREERRSEQVGTDGESFMYERRELECLKAEEGGAEQRGHEQPQLGAAEDLLTERVLGLIGVLDGG